MIKIKQKLTKDSVILFLSSFAVLNTVTSKQASAAVSGINNDDKIRFYEKYPYQSPKDILKYIDANTIDIKLWIIQSSLSYSSSLNSF